MKFKWILFIFIFGMISGGVLFTVTLPESFALKNMKSTPLCTPQAGGNLKCCTEHYQLDDSGEYVDGSSKLWCKTCKWSESKKQWVCGKEQPPAKAELGQTIDPNFDSNAGILIDRGTTGNSIPDVNSSSATSDNSGTGVTGKSKTQGTFNPGLIGGSGDTSKPNSTGGVSPYIGDPGTWNCKFDEASGKNICSCMGGTDCLHCTVYGHGECRQLPKLADPN